MFPQEIVYNWLEALCMIASETILTPNVEHSVLPVLSLFHLRQPHLRCDHTYAYQLDYAHVCQPSPLCVVT